MKFNKMAIPWGYPLNWLNIMFYEYTKYYIGTTIHWYTYVYIYVYVCVYVIVIWWSPFIPSRNLDEVFTYKHMAIMSLRSRSHVKASMVLTRADHLFLHNYIRSLLNNI